jgi:hypothetical protein
LSQQTKPFNILNKKLYICEKLVLAEAAKATWKIGKTFFEGVFILFGTGFYICFNFYVVKLQIF